MSENNRWASSSCSFTVVNQGRGGFSSAALVIIEDTCNACYQSCLDESFLPLHMSISSVVLPLGHWELTSATYCFQSYMGVEILHFLSYSISLLAVMCVSKALGDIRVQLFQVTAAGFVSVTFNELCRFPQTLCKANVFTPTANTLESEKHREKAEYFSFISRRRYKLL